MVIESEERRQQITEDIKRWCNDIKATPLLRRGDIHYIVDTILHEFYQVTFSCGHLGHWEDGVHIAFYTYRGQIDGVSSGINCKDCAEKYKKELGAWEVKDEN